MTENAPLPEMRTLITKRGVIKARITRFSSFVDNITNDNDITQLKLRIEKFESCWSEFEDIQSTIEELDPDSYVAQGAERELFETSYFSAMAAANRSLQRMAPTQSAPASSHSQTVGERDHSNQVKLPVINLPTFNGAYDQWLPFIDTFQSLIHDSPSISDIQKFHYLRSALVGEAAQVIHSLEISSLNYEVAWNLLKDRYQNKRLLVQNHVKALFDLPNMAKESHVALRSLLDTVSRHLRALKTLEQPTETWDTLLIHLITSKFDQTTKREWETIIDSKELPSMPSMTKFLQHRCQLLESLNPVSPMVSNFPFSKESKPPRNQPKGFSSKPPQHTAAHVSTNRAACPKCNQMHFIYQCQEFRSLSIRDRINEVKRLNLCSNCMRGDHPLTQCTSGNCRLCGRKHNTMLHLPSSREMADPERSGTSALHVAQHMSSGVMVATGQGDTPTLNIALPMSSGEMVGPGQKGTPVLQVAEHSHLNQILLSTALINIFDHKGRPHQCRALLDSGSQSNFMTNELRLRLRLGVNSVNVPVTGINQRSTQVSQTTQATIQSRFNAFSASLSFLVLDQITDRLPITKINRDALGIPGNLRLADPHFDSPQYIDMLLGAEIFWNLLCVGQIHTHKNQPILQKTHFGWIVSGRLPGFTTSHLATNHCLLTSMSTLRDQLSRVWELEEPSPVVHQSPDDSTCESLFRATTTRGNDGRFIVQLPLRTSERVLGDSRQTTLRRLYQLEKRFVKDPLLKEQYSKFLNTYLQDGHMELVSDHHDQEDQKPTCYLPHHAVVKEDSLTTKVRVVFDGSARTSTGVALNDLLMTGPTVQQDLVSIVTRFRVHAYVITGDIVKMYRQVQMHPDHTDLQRILWREDPGLPVQTFRLTTVTYGTASAPFLATRCLAQLASEEEVDHPVASQVIARDFYVDDLLSGADTIDEVALLKEEVTEVLSRGCFQMHKWNSNASCLRDDTDLDKASPPCSILTGQHSVKTLGLLWDSHKDILSYQSSQPPGLSSLSKRRMLSLIAGIFDPLGLVGPIIISAKLIIQRLWQLKIDWDESVPITLFTQWKQYEINLKQINTIEIPRHVICEQPVKEIQLHGFCDASEHAYGACIYLRSTNWTGAHSVHLLCAKSRVAPLKTISVPRLELCGALLLAQLATKVTLSLSTTKIHGHHFWTDSTIVQAWIDSSPHLWKSFVANRTCEIQELTNHGTWHHISSRENPADVLSRGTTTSELQNHSLWWHGPEWLSSDASQWVSNQNSSISSESIPEGRNQVHTFVGTCEADPIFERYSSFSKLTRVVAYCLRFKSNCLNPSSRCTGPLQTPDYQGAMICLAKLAQRDAFASEIHRLSQSKPVHPRSKILSLSPFLDEVHVLRVGGRLSNANISQMQRHPIILPSNHRFTTLLIMQTHEKQLHAGPLATLAVLRLQFWPLSGRNAVKRVLRTCVPCFRVRPSTQPPVMGDLPSGRTNPSRPFSITGVDFCGPFKVKEGGRRSKRTSKGYVAVFICFTTKASHLELVGDLTSDSFLGALKRFISRRGKCIRLSSDNATNFVGANRELQSLKKLFETELHQERLSAYLSEEGIIWDFIPAKSPHFGGLWEAGVKACKHHLRRVVGDAALTFEELSTVLTQVESCLNSRPLTPLSNHPSDLTCLTPGHFLIGDSLAAVGEPSLMSFSLNRLSRWQRVQQVTQHFWSRWSKEYLSQLQQRHKWTKPNPQVAIGSMVLLKEDRTPPLRWPLGRVVSTHPGKDGVTRVVSVRTCSGILKRAVTQVCVLPIEA